MESSRELASMDAVQLRNLTATLLAQLTERDAALSAKDAQLANRDQELKAKPTEDRPAHARDGDLKALALRSA
jgi:hypothetical protein